MKEKEEVVVYKNDDEKTRVEEKIFSIRGKQVILDRDLAQLYQVEVSQMNRQVKRNIERFPDDFMFQITKEEWSGLKCHFGISNSRGGDRTLPYAFTENGIAMLNGVLKSDTAIEVNISSEISMCPFITHLGPLGLFFDRGADTCNRYRGLYNLNLISTFARPHL